MLRIASKGFLGPVASTRTTRTRRLSRLHLACGRNRTVVANLNSRLRGYFFLRKKVGGEYLDVLRFFLNHRRFLRCKRPERIGKSPRELLTGETHPH